MEYCFIGMLYARLFFRDFAYNVYTHQKNVESKVNVPENIFDIIDNEVQQNSP